jgi:hypothetical protein
MIKQHKDKILLLTGIGIFYISFLFLKIKSFFEEFSSPDFSSFIEWIGLKSEIAVLGAFVVFLVFLVIKPDKRKSIYTLGISYLVYLVYDSYHHSILEKYDAKSAWLYNIKGSQDLIFLALLYCIGYFLVFKSNKF